MKIESIDITSMEKAFNSLAEISEDLTDFSNRFYNRDIAFSYDFKQGQDSDNIKICINGYKIIEV
jgi:hypothetical protein